MKKSKYVLLLVVVIILIVVGIYITKNRNPIKQNNQDPNTTDSGKIQNVIRDTISSQNLKASDSVNVSKSTLVTIPSNWKTYTNNQYGITFQYPNTWFKNGEDAEIVNVPGTIAAIEINFADTIFHTSLIIEYHFAPEGAKLFQFAVSQFDSSQGLYATHREKTNVGGNNAIKGSVAMNVDGKGHKLHPPLRLIVIDFLDLKQTGEIKMKFKTHLSEDNIENAKFEGLLSTFKFTN